MSTTIDERVVEMRFDNSNFERNTKTSLNTLEKLKAALNMTDQSKSFDSLEKAANNVSLNGIAAGVEALQKRFSTFGIVSMRVIENVTDSVIGLAKKGFNFVENAIVSGGMKRAQNIENAHFQLQALLKDEEKVQAIMDNAMASVSDTAYAYDEAAKAAAQFAASGLEAGDAMETALRGIVGVSAMTNSEYESISRIFTTVAGNGRLMGDQLLQLSSRGLNAASTLADYFKEVRGQSSMTEAEIRSMVSKGQIDFQTFAEAMDWAFGESAFRANETFTGVLSNIRAAFAKIGADFFSPLIEQNSELILMLNTFKDRVNAFKKEIIFDEKSSAISGLTKVTGMQAETVEHMFDRIKKSGKIASDQLALFASRGVDVTQTMTDYINGVTNGTVIASYKTRTALSELTDGLELSKEQVREFIDEGTLGLDIFTSAMENAYGDQRSLSKEFSDAALNLAKRTSEFLSKIDFTKPMRAFYNVVDSAKNVFIGMYSVIKPLGQAFKDVFLNFSGDDVVTLSERLEKLTSKLRLTERSSKGLRDLFTGLFNVVKLLAKAFLGLFGVVVPITKPINSLAEWVAVLAGEFGNLLTGMTEWITKSPRIQRVYKSISEAVQKATGYISDFIRNFDSFLKSIYELPFVQKLIGGIVTAFEKIGEVVSPYVEKLVEKLKDFKDEMAELIPQKAQDLADAISEKFTKLGDALNSVDMSGPSKMFEKFLGILDKILSIVTSNEGLSTFVTNAKDFAKNVKSAFTFQGATDNLTNFQETVDKFIAWVKDKLTPFFSGFSLGGGIAAAGGLGMIFSVYKIAKAIENLSKSIKNVGGFGDVLKGVSGVLKEYQTNLKADSIRKIAISILILAAALTILSFADIDRVVIVAGGLALVGYFLVEAMTRFTVALKKGKDVEDSIMVFTKGLKTAMKQLGRAVEIRAIGKTLKDFGITMALIAGSIIALALMYRKDADAMNQAVTLVTIIGVVLLAAAGIMTAFSKKQEGVSTFTRSSLSILALATSLSLAVSALNKLFKITLPDDWGTKLFILGVIFVALGVLSKKIGTASRLSEGNAFKGSLGIIAAAGALYLAVLALEKLFSLELPNDFDRKKWILIGLFIGLIVLIKAIGKVAKNAQGGLGSAAAILSMCVVIGTIVAALMILSIVPFGKLMKGAIALGVVLVMLGTSLSGAGQITEKDTYKSVLAMAALVGVIVAALGILSIMPLDALKKSVGALGAILIALAIDFASIGKITNEGTWKTVAAMAAMIVVIGGTLFALAGRDWTGLSAAAGGLSAVLVSLGGTMLMLSKTNMNVKKIGVFLLATLSLVPIGIALYALSGQPWNQIVAAGAALSITVLAFAKAMKMISAARGIKPEKIGLFVLASVALIPLTTALYVLAARPWDQMVAAGVALSAVLLAFSVAFDLISSSKPDWKSIAAFVAASAGVALIAVAMKPLTEQPWQQTLAAAASLSIVLLAMSAAMAICALVGSAAPAALAGIGLLDLFIANFALILVALGKIFDDPAAKQLLGNGAEALSQIGTAIGDFAGSIVAGFAGAVSESLPVIGENIADFWENAKPFFDDVGSMDQSILQGILNLGEAILALTAGSIIDGLTRFFGGGSSSLVSFAEELKKFGGPFSEFAKSVEDVKSGQLLGVSNSAKALAEMASTLPNSGGWVGKIFGENDLDDFARNLTILGPSLALFALSVQDVDEESVQGAANAAQIMSDLATNLPNTGGLKAKIFGDNSLSDFAEELVEFGKKFTPFINSLPGAGAGEKVENLSGAFTALVEFANAIPNSGGVVGFFAGNNDINTFGEKLVEFGTSYKNYYDAIKDVSFEQVSNTNGVIRSLILLANDISGVNPASITSFINAFRDLGTISLNNFSMTFIAGGSQIANAINQMITTALGVVDRKVTEFQNRGLTCAMAYAMGVSMATENLLVIGQTIVLNLMLGIDSLLEKFEKKGLESATRYLEGIRSRYPEAKSVGINLATYVISACLSLYSSYYTAGANGAQGYIDGIKSKYEDAKKAGKALGAAVYDAAQAALSGKSTTSYSMTGLGDSAALGFINQVLLNVSEAALAGEELGEAVEKGTRSSISEVISGLNRDIEINPVIRPVLETDALDETTRSISELFNRSMALTIHNTNAASSGMTMRAKKVALSTESSDNESLNQEGKVTNVVFNQYNTSPKALSNFDIYRNTNNQLSSFKRKVENL